MLIIDKWCLICKIVVNVCFSHKEGHVHDRSLYENSLNSSSQMKATTKWGSEKP